VSLLMAITTLLAAWSRSSGAIRLFIVIGVNASSSFIDCIFFAANSTKLFEGGWFPLLLAAVVAFLMLTWRSGVKLVERARGKLRQPEEDLIETAVNRCPREAFGDRGVPGIGRERRPARADAIRQAQSRSAPAGRAGYGADRGIAAHRR